MADPGCHMADPGCHTKLYDCTKDELTLNEIERIVI
jgi:hypothetical protein